MSQGVNCGKIGITSIVFGILEHTKKQEELQIGRPQHFAKDGVARKEIMSISHQNLHAKYMFFFYAFLVFVGQRQLMCAFDLRFVRRSARCSFCSRFSLYVKCTLWDDDDDAKTNANMILMMILNLSHKSTQTSFHSRFVFSKDTFFDQETVDEIRTSDPDTEAQSFFLTHMLSALQWCGLCSRTRRKLVFRLWIAIGPSVFEKKNSNRVQQFFSISIFHPDLHTSIVFLFAVTLRIHVQAPVWSMGPFTNSHRNCMATESVWIGSLWNISYEPQGHIVRDCNFQ